MIAVLFNILLFLIPLTFFPSTSEIFEFNKIILVYISTILTMAVWIYRSIAARKILFRRTILDVPILFFLGVLILSSFISIDLRTSILGYYSRFNGSLLSTVCYALLYWSLVSNLNKKQAINSFYYFVAGTLIASILGILEHFGIFTTCVIANYDAVKVTTDKTLLESFNNLDYFGKFKFLITSNCWVQNIQERVFSTFGQPNWLAAGISIALPLTWFKLLDTKITNLKNKQNLKSIFWLFASSALFLTLIFTKSRSGLLAFGIESLIFWGYLFYKTRLQFLKQFLLINSLFLIIVFSFNNPLKEFFIKNNEINSNSNNVGQNFEGPSLESGGTESGTIRKIVWKGAFEIWKRYPILGTGPETFAYAYPRFKPLEHNLTSEWNFIYNKAHNEYLNYLATTGALGLIAYLSIIFASAYMMFRSLRHQKTKDSKIGLLVNLSLSSSYISILITNFFGFSVVPISLMLFLIPGYFNSSENGIEFKSQKVNLFIKLAIIVVAGYLLFIVSKYYSADINFSRAKRLMVNGDIVNAHKAISKTLELSPNEPGFLMEAANINSEIAIILKEEQNENAEIFKNDAVNQSRLAIKLSPSNITFKKSYASILPHFLVFDPNYLDEAIKAVQSAINYVPNDPGLYYQISLLQRKKGLNNEAIKNLEKANELKPNYKEARFALGIIYTEIKDYPKAKEQFSYILEKIDPKDELTKKYLDEIGKL